MDAETTSEPKTNIDFFGDNDELNAMIKEWRKEDFQIEGLLTLVENINSDDKNKQLYGTIGVRKLISIGTILFSLYSFLFLEDDPPIQLIIDANLIPRLVEFTTKDDQPELQVT